MAGEMDLVGYARKSKDNDKLKLTISVEAFNAAQRFLSQDGEEYVALVISRTKVVEILDGDRSVASVCHIRGE